MRHNYFPCLIGVFLILTCQGPANKQSTKSANGSIKQKVDSVLALMTVTEKIGQLNMYSSFWDATGPAPKEDRAKNKYDHLKKGWVGAILNAKDAENIRQLQRIAVEDTRLGIPLIFGYDVIHGFKTISPIPLAEAASWDLKAIEKSARIAAIEASASGINWTFAPMVDITRDARWGRVMEGSGEDPYLGSKIAIARINGFQGENLSDRHTIAACAKHFAAYGFAEAGKEYNTVDIGTATLHNMVLPPFKTAAENGVKTFMNSFNDLNGIPVTASKELQRSILKGQWGFKGVVVSDWASIRELISWGYAKDASEAAKQAIIAGSDMDMEGYVYINELNKLVEKGAIDMGLIDEAVSRILTLKFELGLFDNPFKYCDEKEPNQIIGQPNHQEAVLDMAKKSIVLLKNNTGLLPLKKEGQSIALIGPLANDKNSPLGNWRGATEAHSAISVLEGMTSLSKSTISFAKGPELVIGETSFASEVQINMTNKKGLNAAVALAKTVDVVVMVLGEHGFQSGEARSRTKLDLPGLQQELLEAVYEVNKNIVLIINSGRPLALTWAEEHIPSILMAWQLGTQAGNAIAQTVFGDYNPGGKLPMTVPRHVGQLPLYYNFKNTGRPINTENNVFWSHYIDSDNAPLYPFGYGLSYTSFKYNQLRTDKVQYNSKDTIIVSVDLTNTGAYDGREVVQLYIRDITSSVIRPVRELKGFQHLDLKQGESKTVTFELSRTELGFYDTEGKFIVEPGDFDIFVGGDSSTTLSTRITIID